jgi:glucose-1-phosphate cytidylyltransferase
LHDGFWHPMDTIRDRDVLNEMWAQGHAPWSLSL